MRVGLKAEKCRFSGGRHKEIFGGERFPELAKKVAVGGCWVAAPNANFPI
jgi:hypothetical protein